MPCNCLGVRSTECSCKLVPKSFLGIPPDLVLVHDADKPTSFVFRLLEGLYDKCAAYNLRYCPLRRVTRRDKSLRTAMKDLIVLLCFLVANFVVFLNIIIKVAVHLFYVLRESVLWIRSRSILKSESKEPFYFTPKEHDYTPPLRSKFKLF